MTKEIDYENNYYLDTYSFCNHLLEELPIDTDLIREREELVKCFRDTFYKRAIYTNSSNTNFLIDNMIRDAIERDYYPVIIAALDLSVARFLNRPKLIDMIYFYEMFQ